MKRVARLLLRSTGLPLGLLVLCVPLSVSFAQHDSLWVRTMYGTGSGIDEVQALAFDPSGNVYALIRGQAGSDTAMVLVKYSLAGERLWWRRFTHPGGVDPCGIAIDPWGDVLVAATSANSTSNPDIMTMKYSAEGDSLWTVYFDDAGMPDVASSIQADDYGNSYVSGTSVTPTGGMDCTLIRYSPYGELRGYRVFDVNYGSQDVVLASVLDTTGYVYQVGACDGWYLAVKYSFVLDRLWFRTGGSSGRSCLTTCALDCTHDLLCGGWTEFSSDSTGILTVKWNGTGNEQWSRCISARSGQVNHAVSVAGDGQANAVVYGWWSDPARHSQNGLLVKYDSAGTELWRALDPDTTAWHELYPGAMTLSPSGDIFTVSIDWIPKGITTVKYSPEGDSLWVKYDSCGIQGGNWSQTAGSVPGGVCIGAAALHRGDERDVVSYYQDNGAESWTRSTNLSYTGKGAAKASDVAFDRAGNVIAVGYLNQTGEFTEFATAKYSPVGDLLWLRTEHGYAARYDEALLVRVDSFDNIYVAGRSEGETTGYDYLTVKYDSDGNRQWAKRYDGPGDIQVGYQDTPTDMVVDRQGNVIVTGRSFGGPTGFDYATVKYSPIGEELWVRRYDGGLNSTPDEARALAADSVGAVFVTGFAYEPPGLYSGTTIKYDAGGTQQWVSHCRASDSTAFFPHGIRVDARGGVWLCGDGTGGLGSHVVARLHANGDTAWVRCTPAPWEVWHSSEFSEEGGLVMCGSGDSGFVAAFDSSGRQSWRQTLGGFESQALARGADGVVYVFSASLNDRRANVLSAYDSLGRLRWTDSSGCRELVLATNPMGLLAAAGLEGGGFTVCLFSPTLPIAPPQSPGWTSSSMSIAAVPSVFAGSVRIHVSLGGCAAVRVGVYDGCGRLMKDLGEIEGSRGVTELDWDGQGCYGQPVVSGVYFVRLEPLESGRTTSSGRRCSAAVKVTKLTDQ